eukprot:5201042-Prorocentrum_lima.AAC.1
MESLNGTTLSLTLQSHKLAGIYESQRPEERYNEVILDLACGIGGFTAAAEEWGFPIVAAVDTNA